MGGLIGIFQTEREERGRRKSEYLWFPFNSSSSLCFLYFLCDSFAVLYFQSVRTRANQFVYPATERERGTDIDRGKEEEDA